MGIGTTEYDVFGTLLSDGDDYLWGAGLIGRIDANDDTTYAHQDGLGSIRLITDDTGAGRVQFVPARVTWR